MGVSTHRARVVWEGGEDLRAHRVELGSQALPSSSAPDLGGDDAKSNPEALLVAALSSCHMLWFLALARKAGFRAASYEDAAEGTLNELCFTRAVLRPAIVWEGEVPDSESLAELHRRSHEKCFIANSVKFPVEVEPI